MTEEETERYRRNILLPWIGGEGQFRLLSSRVFVLGTGGLGSPLLYYLVAAGVGHITLADSDRVDLSNLQRQILFTTGDCGRPKAVAAGERLAYLNPGVELKALDLRIDSQNVRELTEGYDLLLEASDNFSTKFLMNDAAVLYGRRILIGAVTGMEGHILGVGADGKACYRCLFRDLPDSALVPPPSTQGVLGSAAGSVGSLMATEAIRILAGSSDSLLGRMTLVHLEERQIRTISVPRNGECPVCGENPVIRTLEKDRYEPKM